MIERINFSRQNYIMDSIDNRCSIANREVANKTKTAAYCSAVVPSRSFDNENLWELIGVFYRLLN